MKIKAALSICAQCITGIAWLGLVFIPRGVSAQTDTAKKLKEVKVKEKPIPQVQTIAPAQQVSVTDLDRITAVNVADAVRDFSGVNIKDYGGIGGLKTVSVRGLGADHLVVLYDGVAINDAENGQIDLGKYNLNGIGQITLYNAQPENILSPARSFASAGVIVIDPVQPHLSPDKPYKIVLGVNGGSFGFINPYLQWQQRISDRWSYTINGYFENANGRYKFKNPEDGSDTLQNRTNGDIKDQRIDGSLYWFKNDSNKFSLHINYYNSDRGLPAAVVNYNPFSDEQLWNRDAFVQGSYLHTWNNGLHLLLNTKLSREFTRYIDPDYQNNSNGIDSRYTQREAYQSVALGYHITGNWRVSYAGDVAISTVGAASPNNSISNYAFPSRFTFQEVLASKLTLGRWRFEGDLLHSYVNEWVQYGKPTPNQDVLSPTLMATFQPFAKPDLEFRAFYKDIFREPTLDEQYLFDPLGSRGVKPEFAKQFDLGLAYRKAYDSFLEYLTITIDGYYNRVTNKIIDLPEKDPSIPSVINLGSANISGVDIGVKTQTRKLGDWRALLSINYTYQHTIDPDHRLSIPYVPANAVTLNAGAEYKSFGVYYNEIVSSSRLYLEDANSVLNSYAAGDLALVYKGLAGSKAFTFSTHINNVFNQQYAIVRSFPMPGRSYLFSFQINI